MSRIRNTLDSVTKAVSSTDLISKLSRFRPGGSTAGRADARQVLVNTEPPTSTSTTSTSSTAETAMTASKEDQNTPVPEGESQGRRHKEEPSVGTAPEPGSASSASAASSSRSASSVAKQTLQLFHPAALSANVDNVAKHVNSYFGVGTHKPVDGGEEAAEGQPPPSPSPPPPPQQQQPQQGQQSHSHRIPVAVQVADRAKPREPLAATLSPPFPSSSSSSSSLPPPVQDPPRTPPPPTETDGLTPRPATPKKKKKKGFTQYLSYPRPSMQAFVGSYMAPSLAAEKEKVLPPEEEEVNEVDKGEEEARKMLLTQREKIMARVSVDSRTRALVKDLQRVTDVKLLTARVEQLSCHLLEFPETRGVAVKAAVREALALVGYTDPVKGRGIRVLAIDGGGTRGLMALQTLHKLQELTGKPIHQLFDYICGVSTGAILAFMLGVFQIPLDECEEMYRKLGSDVFKRNVIVGTLKMGWSHAFYDCDVWESILKERMGEGLMVESARGPNCIKVSAVSTIVNRGLPLKAHVFRNYRLMPGVRSHYIGDCKDKMWQAIRASSAAPGYFQEFVLGKDLHQDGGLLVNNPAALAIHECKCLWPDTPLQCVVSLGTGRHDGATGGGKPSVTSTSLRT
ncbi:hypothetical protein NHX12_020342, partial [Muraenolepis orangiensis]